MKHRIHPRLAWEGIRKNKRLYLPYFLTCTGMVMMSYIIRYLAAIPALEGMPGGGVTAVILKLGFWTIALFALIFLLYTNSFFMRRRKKEFSLYNILGMGKGNLSVLLLWETIILFAGSVAAGLFFGVLLSKLAELGLIRILNGQVTYLISVDAGALRDTVWIFGGIFCLIFLNSLWQMWRMSAVSLLRSESTGEKPPKANYLLGIAGAALLAGAYYIAVTIESPLVALAWFFIAVMMVIVATYLLFVSGSVTMCRLLQKNKRYYYRKNHFVSVSSMAFRMKRNGEGLASICILSTMVLVMMMGAGSLYFGAEDSLNTRYPHQITVSVDFLSSGEYKYAPEKEELFLERIHGLLESRGTEPENLEQYLSSSVAGILKDGKLVVAPRQVNAIAPGTVDDVAMIYLIPLHDYNRCMGTRETLAEGEVMLHCVRRSYDDPTIQLSDGTVWHVKKQLDLMMGSSDAAMDLVPSVFVVTADLESAMDTFNMELGPWPEDQLCRLRLGCGFDTSLSADEQIRLSRDVEKLAGELNMSGQGGFYAYSVECREAERGEFYGLYGGLFYLGAILSLVFLTATSLIIYYKQVAEGYEDEARFALMRNVGMTAEDIRKSVNSQMRTVFFLPLVTAAVHIGFAFPIVQKLLAMFNLRNTALSLVVTGVVLLVFGVFYTVIYRVTSNAYYAIVSGAKETQ